MKKLVAIIALLIQTFFFAQEMKFEAKLSKSTLGLNERLQINFVMDQDGDNFDPPNFEGFRIVGGPFQSTNFSWINSVKSFNKSYSYILQPTKQGTFTIGSAIIEYDGKNYKTEPIKVTVTKAIEMPKDPNSPDYKAGEGVHLVAEVSKTNPYVNEPVTVVYKLYFDPRFVIRNVQEVANPKYNGFWSQHIDIAKLEAVAGTYNGQDYAMVVWRKVILYPQEEGVKPIEPLSINLDIDIPTRKRMGFFEQTVYASTSKKVSAGSKSLTVKPLPENGKPASFTGAVGNFDFKVTPSKTELKNRESLDIEVSVSGTGNLKLFTLPKPEFPSAFEVFDPEHQEKVETPLTGMNGKISDKYTLIPQFKGKYTTKPLEFSYFDLATKSYKTIISDEIVVDVLDGPENTIASSNKNTVAKQAVQKSNAFQFIKLNTNFDVIQQEDFLGSKLFYILLFVPFLLIPIVILAKKKKEAIDADDFGNKVRRNSKLAKKYLSEAKKQLGAKVPFYMAMEKALHNFLKAKLHIETSEMSKDNIQELLENKKANSETISNFIELMNTCELARYAPSTNVTMQNDYDRAVSLISDLEKQL